MRQARDLRQNESATGDSQQAGRIQHASPGTPDPVRRHVPRRIVAPAFRAGQPTRSGVL
jgi:hypothetical protein